MQEFVMLSHVVSCIPRIPRTNSSSGYLSPLSKSCWVPEECWWKQMWKRCFWGSVLPVTSERWVWLCEEQMQWRKTAQKTELPCFWAPLLCPRRLLLWLLLSTALLCTQIASDSVLRALCSFLFPGPALLVLVFFHPTPLTCISLCYQWFPASCCNLPE